MPEIAYCECGCGGSLPLRDLQGRERRFLHGHNGRHGDPLERFMSKVVWNGDEDECWTWGDFKDRHGYGRFRVGGRGGKVEQAHRFGYELFIGPIPEGLELDHLCRHPSCVNPAHLEPVTHAENVRRGKSGAWQRLKTHCPQGHPLAGDNLYVYPDGRRQCRECDRAASRRYRKRRSAGESGSS